MFDGRAAARLSSWTASCAVPTALPAVFIRGRDRARGNRGRSKQHDGAIGHVIAATFDAPRPSDGNGDDDDDDDGGDDDDNDYVLADNKQIRSDKHGGRKLGKFEFNVGGRNSPTRRCFS